MSLMDLWSNSGECDDETGKAGEDEVYHNDSHQSTRQAVTVAVILPSASTCTTSCYYDTLTQQLSLS
ncbi:hypothetical protein ACH3XW_0205 [Acanthocheilonema viteae]